jgi:predicted metal-dependent HD superfamily phosphohydrolase
MSLVRFTNPISRAKMKIRLQFPIVDELLASYSGALGDQAAAYRNHVYRGLNYFAALAGSDESAVPHSVLVAAAFHDLGIWTDETFDYLEPSVRLARAYLASHGLGELAPEVAALITEHHKLRAYHGPFANTVELFRRADLVDLSLGAARAGLAAKFVHSVKAAFPDEGFHAHLVSLAAKQVLKTPFRPFPMIRW